MGPVDLDAQGHGLLVVEGPNGVGKTSFLRALAGLLEASEGGTSRGELTRDARVPRPEDVGLMPQDPLDGLLAATPRQEFELRCLLALHSPRSTAPSFLASDLEFERMSAGELRRIGLEISLLNDPSLLLLDEPLDHLSARWRHDILDRVDEEARRRLVVVATCDPGPWEAAATWTADLGDPSGPSADASGIASSSPNASHHPRIEVDRVSLVKGAKTILREASLTLGPGLHVLSGDNGSGKTTFLRTLFGFEPTASGRIRLDGLDPLAEGPKGAQRAAVLLMEHPSRMFFSTTVAEEVAFGRRPNGTGALGWVGLGDRAGASPFKLSRGQKERLALAIVAASDHPIVLLDEPSAGLDSAGFGVLLSLLEAWRGDRCLLVASHDPRLLARADTRLLLERGTLRKIPIPSEASA